MSQPSESDLPRRRPWRLRTRLALALLAVFIPISILLIVTHLENLDERRTSRVENFRTISETIAALIDGFARDMESLALSTTITLGEVPPEAAANNPALQPYLAHLAESYGNLRTIFITDLDGRVLTGSTGEGNGTDLSSRNYIAALKEGADEAWSGAIPGLQSGQTTLAYARVIISSEGERRFFFVLAFYPNQLVRRLPDNLPSDARVSLVDNAGRLIYRSDDPDQTLPPVDFADSPAYQEARAGRSVAIESQTTPITADEKRHGAYAPVSQTDWVVGLTVPTRIVDGPLESRFRRDLLIMGGLLLAGFAAMILIANRLSRPLSALSAAAEAIARGERPLVPDAARDAEVYKLETAMAGMSRAVVEREERLASQARVLETLDRVGESLATELDFNKAVASITQASVDVTRAEVAALFHKSSEPGGGFELLSVAGGDGSFPMRPDDAILERTFNGESVYAAELAALPGRRPSKGDQSNGDKGLTLRSFLGLPVVSRTGERQGALFLLDSRPGAFDEYQQGLARGLARRASIVLENARLYSEAQEVQAQLRRANTAKDEFLALISHELRTPITTIFGGARLLHSRRRSLPEESTDEMIASIEDEAERLYRLVEDLLAIARADLSEEVVREPVELNPIIEQVVKQFTNRHPGRPVEVRGGKEPRNILAETTYVHQVLNNLITNADKYSDSGLPIEVELSVQDGESVVRVLDRGPGVAPEEMDQIFDSFYRSQRTARQAQGKGLGLTVCKRLIEAMAGRIWASPREGGGLEVGFALPLALEDASVEVTASDRT